MGLANTRIQHAVGQGFFHAEELHEGSTLVSGFGQRQILFIVPGGPDSPGAPDLDGGRPEGPDGHDVQGLRDEKGQVT